MTSDAAETAGEARQALAGALHELAQAVNAMQLYPAASPVVTEAVTRVHESLQPILRSSPLALAVLPESLRVDGVDVGDNSHNVRRLAERVHRRGVSHLHLDSSLTAVSLQRLAKLLAMNRDALNEAGGISGHLDREPLPGVSVEMLRLERLYEKEETAPEAKAIKIWETLLEGFSRAVELERTDWETLASEPRQFEALLDWLLAEADGQAGLSDFSRVELVRLVCDQVGNAAADLGREKLEQVVEVISGLSGRLDNEVWIDLLSDPILLENEETLGPAIGTGEAMSEGDSTAAGEDTGIDLSRCIAGALPRSQVEELLVYALQTRREDSPRLFQLFDRVLERRSDRDAMAQAIRDAVERHVSGDESRRKFSEIWPELSDTLREEQADPWVEPDYRGTLEQAMLDELPTDVWALERIEPRMRELDSSYLAQRKAKIMLTILDAEDDDDEYVSLADELERSFPELIIDGQYIATEEILTVIARHLDPNEGHSVEQRQAAREILLRFCNQHTLREVVRNLAGKPRTQIDAATRIFQSLGPMAIPALLEALSQENSRRIRVHLMRMLSTLGDQALPEIKKHLSDQRWFFVRNLVWVIGEIGDSSFVHHLGLIADHPDERVRREAVRTLAKMGGGRAISFLLSALDDDDEEIRLIAVRGLGRARSRDSVVSLGELLRLPNLSGQNTEIIHAAAIALGKIGDRRALGPLRRVARPPFLFRRRRLKATEAARWARRAIRGEEVDAAPDETTAPRPRGDVADEGGGAPESRAAAA